MKNASNGSRNWMRISGIISRIRNIRNGSDTLTVAERSFFRLKVVNGKDVSMFREDFTSFGSWLISADKPNNCERE